MKTTHNNTARAFGKSAIATLAMVAGTVGMIAACSSVQPAPKVYSQNALPESIRVPAGNDVAFKATAVGMLDYECKANVPTAGTISWVLVNPKADLMDRSGKTVGHFTGSPGNWRHVDGSGVLGSHVAIAPAVVAVNLPLQLLKATPDTGSGALQGITYVQRVNTRGGQDFSKACTQADLGDKESLPYQAEYIFWKAA